VTEDKAHPLGEWLRQRREELDVSLEQADADTRIRARYLEALEAEDIEALPNQVVARGFLRNYAAYLELDPKEAADRYAAIAGAPEAESPPLSESSPFDEGTFQPVPLHEMPGQRSRWWLAVGLLVVVVAALALAAWRGYPYISSWFSTVVTAPDPTPIQRTAGAALPTTTHTPTATAVMSTASVVVTPSQATPTLGITLSPTLTQTPTFTPTPTNSPTPTEPVYTGIFLELVFSDISWIQVTVDEVRQFQGELEAGTYRSWYGEERIELRVGNAGVVEVTVNGEKLGFLGAPGEVVDRVFEITDNEVTEATVTPLPTLVPSELTATAQAPSPTPTLVPTQPITPSLIITPTATVTSTAGP
jgi:cytoskeleton protein RodZ